MSAIKNLLARVIPRFPGGKRAESTLHAAAAADIRDARLRDLREDMEEINRQAVFWRDRILESSEHVMDAIERLDDDAYHAAIKRRRQAWHRLHLEVTFRLPHINSRIRRIDSPRF